MAWAFNHRFSSRRLSNCFSRSRRPVGVRAEIFFIVSSKSWGFDPKRISSGVWPNRVYTLIKTLTVGKEHPRSISEMWFLDKFRASPNASWVNPVIFRTFRKRFPIRFWSSSTHIPSFLWKDTIYCPKSRQTTVDKFGVSIINQEKTGKIDCSRKSDNYAGFSHTFA